MSGVERETPPRRTNGQCLKMVDFLVNDILMVVFSLSDIVLDILVCRQFYLADRMEFFYVSLAIFLFAQCCYSFLFALHWGKEYSSPMKCLLFFLVLPFGQFVPFLAWIESFEFKWVARLFDAMHLYSKYTPNVITTREFEDAGGDLLYDYIQKKFYSHAGFLVEALAEAIPQSILQTIAVLYFGEPSPLFIISIFVSICVISSKGYLISYSMHRPTFFFNVICIFADVLCMFATICWLFDHEKDGDDDTTELFDVHDEIKAAWMCLFCGAAGSFVVSSFCFMLFLILDRHHEIDIGSNLYAYNDSVLIMFIELYLTHFLVWFFSQIPFNVSLLTFKFIYFPVSSQNQDQCTEFAKFKTFYTALHKLVSTNKSDLKLHITNRFLFYCKGNQFRLETAVNLENSADGKRAAVREWLETVVIEDMTSINNLRHTRLMNEQSAILFETLNTADPQEARSQVRQFNTKSDTRYLFKKGFVEDLVNEFKVFETFFTDHPALNFPTIMRPLASLRYFLALLAAVIGFPLFALFLLTTAVFLVYSWLYPLIELTRALVLTGCNFSAISTLPMCLTIAYVATLAAMLSLLPSIFTFNLMCSDIVPLIPRFPPAFYNVMVVNRIKEIYDAEMTWHYLDRVFDSHFGMDVTLIIKSFLGAGALNVEGLYGSRSLRTMRVVVPTHQVPLSPPPHSVPEEEDE